MTIITLKGETCTGKTELITELYNELCMKDSKQHFYSEEGANKKDFKALITYSNKKIAFCSIGYIADYGHLDSEYILRGIVFASKNEADVLINAYTEPFPEFPESIYKAIIGKNKYNPIPIKDGSREDIKNKIYTILG